MFRGDDQGAFWNPVETAILHLDVADHAHQPDRAARPPLRHGHDSPTRHDEGRYRDDDPEHQSDVEQHVEDQRTQENRNHARSDQLAAALRAGDDPVICWAMSGDSSSPRSASRTRTSAATYLAYSD